MKRETSPTPPKGIQADWRPVLLIESFEGESPIRPGVRLTNDRVELLVRNCGRGPVLDTAVRLYFLDVVAEPQRTAIAPGDTSWFWWDRPKDSTETLADHVMGRITYADLSYAGYETSFAIRHGDPFDEIDWQRVDRDVTYQPPLYGP